MIHWKKIIDVWLVKHTTNLFWHCHFYIIMNYQMTEQKEQDLQIEKVMWSVTEKALREEIKNLENELQSVRKILRGYKDYVKKCFTNDPAQIKMIMLTQQIVEVILPIDDFKAKTNNWYLREMLMYRWHLAISIEEFVNDYLKRLNDKKFRNEVLKDIQCTDDDK